MKKIPEYIESLYTIESIIGSGSFGIVLKAKNKHNNEIVAIKSFEIGSNLFRSYIDELRLVFRFNHPNIVRAKDIFFGSVNYIIYEYINNGDLRSFIENNKDKLTEKTILKIISDIGKALKYIHEQGILHRDIKPENILIQEENNIITAKITDFGISKFSKNAINIQTNKGSPAYMAPEQFYTTYDSRADLYSLGIILYELLTGKRPFYGSMQELMKSHLNNSINFNKKEIKNNEIKNILEKLLKKSPEDRYQNADDLLKDIDHALNNILKINNNKTNNLDKKTLGKTFKNLRLITYPNSLSIISLSNKKGVFFYNEDDFKIKTFLSKENICETYFIPETNSLLYILENNIYKKASGKKDILIYSLKKVSSDISKYCFINENTIYIYKNDSIEITIFNKDYTKNKEIIFKTENNNNSSNLLYLNNNEVAYVSNKKSNSEIIFFSLNDNKKVNRIELQGECISFIKLVDNKLITLVKNKKENFINIISNYKITSNYNIPLKINSLRASNETYIYFLDEHKNMYYFYNNFLYNIIISDNIVDFAVNKNGDLFVVSVNKDIYYLQKILFNQYKESKKLEENE